ncbi:Uncharacterized protein TCAP_04934 [Tolypocladium capitatum]|uniref:C2H2-type domain-containing protein n=1 Tax=Tolypocladium capitatum TaxID=45235 RepID=A0A2K3QC52_9HYPO|nr:Uncharacterized protein TCAP_04934 [Tolypocladium capitatum]
MSSASSPVSITTPESDAGSFPPTSPSPAFEAQDCRYRGMVRQLLSRFSRKKATKQLRVDGSAPLAVTHGGGHVALAPDDVAHGMMCYTSRFEALDDMSPRALQRSVPHPPARAPGAATRTGRRSSSRKTDYACGFCAEIAIPKTCTRRNDLRRHIDQFHNTNAQWLCQHPGCRMAFDWSTAYQIHLREDHGGSLMKVSEAKVVLCPQTVFACGYKGCSRVFEAADDADAVATWKLYTTHLIKHCEGGRGIGSWDYSHRMRNLLSQTRLSAAWEASSPDGGDGSGLQWDPASSRTMRKLLETRHVDNPHQLVNCAMMLASATENPHRVEAAFDLGLPIKRECPAAAAKHGMGDHSPPMDMVLGVAPYSMHADLSLAIPTRSSGPSDGYTGYNDGQALPTPVTSPHALYGLPGTALYQAPEEAAQRQHYTATNDAVAGDDGHRDPWATMYNCAELHMGDHMALEECSTPPRR